MNEVALTLVRILYSVDRRCCITLEDGFSSAHGCFPFVRTHSDDPIEEAWQAWRMLWQRIPISTDFLRMLFIGKCCSGSSLLWMSQEISSWPFQIITTLEKTNLTYGNESFINSLKFPGVHLYNLLSEKVWNWNSEKITLLITTKTSQVWFWEPLSS